MLLILIYHFIFVGHKQIKISNNKTEFIQIKILLPWLGGSVGWSNILYTQKVVGLIPGQGTYLGCGFGALWGRM